MAARVAVPGAARIVLVCGGSGNGKTAWLIRQLKKDKARRVLVWDMKGEYARDFGYRLVQSKAELLAILRRSATAKISFQSVDPKDFDFFCRAAYAWGNCTVIAEELADVTTPGKAPLGWGMVVRRGRDRRLIVYGVTQRPSESDKTIVGNRTLVHCCGLPRNADRAYMAKEMSCDKAMIDNLKPMQYIESAPNGLLTTRVLTF